MNESQKYCRSLHAQISLGTTSDDRFMPNGYIKAFSEMPNGLVLTEKLDGENNAFTKYGLFARSHTAPTVSPWTKPLRERWDLLKNDLGNLELFGEGMYGTHSIEYSKLESYYYLFGVRELGRWLSWEEVKFYAALFDFPTVPEINITVPLNTFYKPDVDENKLLSDWLKANLKMTWEESVETSGLLGGFDPVTNKPCSEGFVIRNADGFETNGGVLPVAENEFNNLMKLVRGKHVKTDEHWTKNWRAAELMDYTKFNWHSYEFMNTKKKETISKEALQFTEVYDIERAKDIGKIVKYSGEYGLVMLAPSTVKFDKIVVRWDTNKDCDYEGYGQLEYKFIDEYEFKHINLDGTLKK